LRFNNAIEPTGNSLGGFLQTLVAPVGSWQALGTVSLGENQMNKVFWLVIIAGAVALNAMQSNLEYALGFTLPWFVLGLVLSPIWWLATKKGRNEPWKWYDWLNAAAYVMVILFLLRFAIHSYVGSMTANAADLGERSELHERIDQAILSLGSSDSGLRQQAADFLLAAPPVFRSNMEDAYMKEAAGVAKSLPQQIDEYTTFQSLFVSADATYVGYTVHFNKNDLSVADSADKYLSEVGWVERPHADLRFLLLGLMAVKPINYLMKMGSGLAIKQG